jgi:superfamily II DNA/RNA helicase
VTAYVLETIYLTAVSAEDTFGMPESGFADDAASVENVTFASLGVPAPIVAALADRGITTPFPVQAATLPDALAGRDVLGRAQTGSGKTLGFSIPLVTRLAGGSTASGHPRGLVLVPTRELATQVEDVLAPLARAMGLRVATIYGGVSYRPQIIALERATDILVACPGRLADLINQGHCDLSDIEITVIDEADQMADLGFLPIVRRLLEATPADGQRLLFSATLDNAIDVLIKRFLTDPAQHSVDENSSPAEIEHHVITIGHKQRMEIIAALAGGDKRSLVFTRTKHGAQRLARQLTEAGIPAAELHGNLRQGARAKNLAAFASGIAQVMVATDIAARGIHVDGIDLVIHADPPAEHKAYVHRSGRTARGGADGVVVTLQTAAQAREVRRLMREAGVSARQAEATPDSEVLREIAGPPAPRVQLPKPVTDMVKLPKRHPASGGPGDSRTENGRRGDRRRGDGWRSGKPRRRADRRAGDRPEQRGDRQERFNRQDRFSRDEPVNGNERSGRQDRFDRFDRSDRKDRFDREDRAERTADRDRPGQQERFDRDRPARRGYGDRDSRYERPARRGAAAYGHTREDQQSSPRDQWNSRGGRDDRAPRQSRDDWAPARRQRDNWAPRDGARDERGQGDQGRGDRNQGENRRGGRNYSDRGYADRNYDDRRDSDQGNGDRRGGGDRSWSGNGRSWERNGRPARTGGVGRRSAGSDRRPSGAGGRTGRPEFPGRTGAARNHRNSGQGRHF